MKTNKVNMARLLAAMAGLALASTQAFGASVNITMADPNAANETGNTNTWQKSGPGVFSDYQEVEPGMVATSAWDLAAFTADTTAKTLGIVAGYDMKNGYGGTTMGDIFVSANPPIPVTYPDGTVYPQFMRNGEVINGGSGMSWDFAIKLVWTSATAGNYYVYALDANSVLENGEYSTWGQAYNAASMPWKLATAAGNGFGTDGLSGTKNYGSLLAVAGNTFTYTSTNTGAAASALIRGGTAVTDAQLNSSFTLASTSDYKYYVELQNMNWLSGFQAANFPDYFHTTMWCGNDDLWGSTSVGFQVQVPDGGMTLAMLGIGLVSIAGLARWKRS